MIILNSTDNLRVNLNNAITTSQFDMLASFRDLTISTNTYSPNRNLTQTNSVTDVNLVTAPSAGTNRIID